MADAPVPRPALLLKRSLRLFVGAVRGRRPCLQDSAGQWRKIVTGNAARGGARQGKRTVLQPAPHSLKRWACAVRTAHKALRMGGQCRMCGGGYAA